MSCFPLLTLLCIIPLSLKSQSIDIDSLHVMMHDQFDQLSIEQLNYSYLSDYTLGPVRYDLIPLDSASNTPFTTENYLLTHHSIFSSYIPDSNNIQLLIPTDSLYKNWIKMDTVLEEVALSGYFIRYHALDTNKYHEGKLDTQNNEYIANLGSGEYLSELFKSHSTFAISSIRDTVYNSNVNFRIHNALWFSNVDSSEFTIEYSLNNRDSFSEVRLNEEFELTSLDTGKNTLHFKINSEEGSSYMRWFFRFESLPLFTQFSNPGTCIDGYRVMDFVSDESYVDESTQIDHGKAKGWVTVRYSNPNDCVIRRPLIVVEGFDTREFTEGYYFTGDRYIQSFYNKIGNVNSINLTTLVNDYDIIYIDWKNGTDLIEKNALLVEAVINWVNDNKEPPVGETEELENVVWGVSMGGVVSRYALNRMEDNSIDHDTRLFLSEDAPHNGANIPLGYSIWSAK